jgi:DNA-binding SARP family transcriptional activator
MADVLPGSGWMAARRELLSSYSVIAAERLAEETFERGDYRRCVLVCLRALAADPAGDDIVAWMLRAYARLGHFGELDYAYRAYLRAAGLDPADPRAREDTVVRTYEDVIRARAVNE